MDDFSHLSTLSEDAFELERNRIIGSFINSSPPEQRRALLATQYRLDMLRDKSTPEQFLKSLFAEIGENLENMGDQFVAIGHQLGLKPQRA